MDDRAVRELVRETIARHLAPPSPAAASTGTPAHPSHALYLRLAVAGDTCLIEPAIHCTHCGYCKSHGF